MRRSLLVLALVAAACGDDNPVRHLDAHVADTGQVPDGPSPDTPASAVTLTITNSDGAPNPGIHVYFQNADSTMVASLVTDVTGTVSAVMAAGGYVTAINPFTLPPGFGKAPDDVETFAGVKPGDHLRLDAQSFIGASTTVIAPPDPDAAVLYYNFYSTCYQGNGSLAAPTGSGQPDATGSFFLYDCGPTADVLIVTLDSDFLARDFIYAPNTTITDQGTIDLSAMTYTAATTRNYTFTNTPTIDDVLVVNDVLLTAHGALFQGQTNAGQAAGPPVQMSQPMPAFTGAFDAVLTSEQPPSVVSTRSVLDWGPYAATYSLDYQAHLVPDITAFPTLDPAMHQLTWTEAGGNLPPQMLLGRVSAFRSATVQSWQWSVVAPHDTKLTLPTLPTDLADYNIAVDDSFNVELLISANVPGGYDAVRPGALDLLASQNGPLGLVNVTPGQLAFSQASSAPTLTRQAPRGWLRPQKPKAARRRH